MANEARLFDFPEQHPKVETHLTDLSDTARSDLDTFCKTALLDISVDAETDDILAAAHHHAKIRLQLPPTGATARHPNFAAFISSHTRGRGSLTMIDERNVLSIGFSVLHGGSDQVRLVERFAGDVARFLDLSATALLTAEVVEMTPARLARVLSVLGVQAPDLRLV